MNSASRLIKALKCQPVDSTPIWIMRQAGRYLPEYRAIREKAGGFLAMCQNPELACEITLQPLKRFDLDAAIIFSDILTIPDAMGLGLSFETGEGPVFERPIRDKKAVDNLIIPDPEADLGYVMQAIRLVVEQIPSTPLIGFCGSPWTVATYMVEGKSSRSFSLIKAMMYEQPSVLSALLSKVAKASCLYLEAQIAAGAQAVMVFDTWGGILSKECYQQFSLNFMQEIVNYIKSRRPEVPIILFTKQGGQWLEEIAQTGTDAIGIDWTVDMQDARRRVNKKIALQGNLDPAILNASPEVISQQVQKVLEQYGPFCGHIFNLGHGITPDISPEKVQIMIEAVRKYRPALRE